MTQEHKQSQQPAQSLHAQAIHLRSLVNKEGRVNVHGHRDRRNPFADLYHFFFSLSWPAFFSYVAGIYSLINLFFGSLYFIDGVNVLGATGSLQRFIHCIFLSIENLTAVDFSKVDHVSDWVYFLMTLQAFLGILTVAVITGLFYARFSRPTARIIFSNKVISGNHNGKPCLMLRIANERLNQIAEAHVSMHMTRNEVSIEGEHTRKFYDLRLEREHSPLFALSWTVRHYIDDHSPFHKMDMEKLRADQAGIMVSLTGTDETFAAPIIARHAYAMEDIVFNKRFKDIIVWQGHRVHIDLKAIHEMYELELIQGKAQ